MLNNVPFYVILIVLSIIVGLARFKKLSPPLIRIFIPFLLLTAFVELATPLKIINFKGDNHWFFNLYIFIEFLFLGYVYYRILHGKKMKLLLLISFGIGLVAFFINGFFIQGFLKFHTISYRINSAIIIIWILSYFKELLHSPDEITLLKDSVFWISTGVLFFYLGFFFYLNAFDYIVYNNLPYNKLLWTVISRLLNYIFYSCVLISFLCPKTTRR